VTKVIVKKLRSASSKKSKKSKATIRRVRRTKNGVQATVYIVDSGSQTFDDDLVGAFKANITAERRANTAIFGSPDGPKES
jgi:hypothetical protein